MISALHWIQRGKSAPHPRKYVLDESEMDRVSKMANVQFEDAKAQLERAQRDIAQGKDPFSSTDVDEEWEDDDNDNEADADEAPVAAANGDGDEQMDEDTQDSKKEDAVVEDPDDLSRYNLDEYDDDVAEDSMGGGAKEATAGAFTNIRGLAVYQSNDEDPYVTVKDSAEGDDEDERQELEIYPTDNLIVTAKTEDDVSQLEAYVYAAQDSNLYVHHDLMLPSFPLCLEWLDYTPAAAFDDTTNPSSADQNSTPSSSTRTTGQLGNFIAVGTMDPEIEVWSMDVIDGMYPDAILGRKSQTELLNAPVGTGKKKRKQARARIPNAEYHVDAVLGLSWNPIARNLLASASADSTVKLWDLSRPHTGENSAAFRSFTGHTDKVQSVAWQCKAQGGSSSSSSGATSNPAILLTGSYDKTIRVFDTRTPDQAAVFSIGSDVESVVWNGWKEHEFLVSLEDGLVHAFDARIVNQPTWTLQAHDTACTSVDVSPHIPNCILTSSSDKSIKIWNITDPSSSEDNTTNDNSTNGTKRSINLTLSRDLGIGKIFSAKWSPNDPLTLAAGGSSGQLQVFNALSNLGVRKTFGDRLRKLKGQHKVDIDGNEPNRGDGIIRVQDDSEDEEDDDDMQN